MSTHTLRYTPRIIRPAFKKSYSTAAIFSDARSAEFLAAAPTPDSIPRLQGLPEVVVTGRANVGKSSLFNVVLGRKDLLNISKKAGRTRSLNFYRVGAQPGKLVLVDAPGYGSRGRPEWGVLFNHYLQNRKELRRVYALFNAKHGIKQADIAMLRSLNEQCLATAGSKFTFQAVITKVDALTGDAITTTIQKMRQQIFEAAPTCLPPILTSVAMVPPFGVDEMRTSIIEACTH